MTTPLLLVTSIIYFIVSGSLYRNHVGMSIAFFCYGVANIGFIIEAWSK